MLVLHRQRSLDSARRSPARASITVSFLPTHRPRYLLLLYTVLYASTDEDEGVALVVCVCACVCDVNVVCQVGVPILEKELSSLSIPDISGSAGTPIGTVDYHLTQ